jgi:LemA protein
MTALIIILVLVVLCVLYYISMNNTFVSLQNKIEEAFSTMDVYLTKRADLVPNLVNCVKGYMTHETQTLEAVVAARNKAVSAGSHEEKIQAADELSSGISKIVALAESYPELKADTMFNNLMNQLNSLEDDIATSRRYYNGVVRQYNTKIDSFPSSIVAKQKNLVRQPLYEVSDESKRENVKVEF